MGEKCARLATLLSGIVRFAHLVSGFRNSAAGLKMPQGMSNVAGMNGNSSIYDVAVVGAGPTALSAAIAIAQSGARTALIARRSPYADNRTTALLGASVDFLRALEVWSHCQDK